MKALQLLSGSVALACLMVACKPDLDEAGLGGGSLNLARYVAVGDSYTAGFMNNGLYRQGQEYSFPAMINAQMARAGGSPQFVQPYMPGSGTGYLRLAAFPDVLETVPADPAAVANEFVNSACFPYGREYFYSRSDVHYSTLGNLGVPNLRLFSIGTPDLGNTATMPVTPSPQPGITPIITNTFFERLLPGPTDPSSYLQVAHSTNPTVFTAWFGMDELLTFALSGGTCGHRTIGSIQPLPDTTFTTPLIRQLLDTLSAGGAKGAIGNLPNITDFPYFRLLPNNEVRQMALAATGHDSVVVALPGGGTRLLDEKDIVLNQYRHLLGQPDQNGFLHGYSANNPLTNEEVLSTQEQNNMNASISKYNAALRGYIVKEKALYAPAVDISGLISNLNRSFNEGGVTYSSEFIRGEFFSLDGLHFSARGNAIIANLFIQALNDRFNTFIPQVNPNDFPSTQRP